MKDTRFFIPSAERDRLAAVYASSSDGHFVRAPEGSKGQGHYVNGPRKSFAGGAGLTSTARDYARFLDAIREGGAIGGVRILSPRTALLMHTNQSGTLHSTTGLGFGYGFETIDRYGASGLAGVGAAKLIQATVSPVGPGGATITDAAVWRAGVAATVSV